MSSKEQKCSALRRHSISLPQWYFATTFLMCGSWTCVALQVNPLSRCAGRPIIIMYEELVFEVRFVICEYMIGILLKLFKCVGKWKTFAILYFLH